MNRSKLLKYFKVVSKRFKEYTSRLKISLRLKGGQRIFGKTISTKYYSSKQKTV